MVSRARLLLFMAIAAVAGVAVVMVLYRQYDNDLRAAQTRIASGSHVAETPCGPIEYAVAGNGPHVLMVHGAGGGFDQGLEFASPLVTGGFTVIAPSRYGYLRTPLPADASPRAQAQGHACLLDALGVDTVAAIGGSAGAPSVIQFCLEHAERCSAMILVVPATSVAEPGRPPVRPTRFAEFMIRTTLRFDFGFWMSSRFARDAMIESILGTPAQDFANAPANERQRVLTALQHIQPVSRRANGLWVDGTITMAPADVAFEDLAAPTLIVTTENDGYGTLIGARIAARRIPKASLITYPDGGHLWVGHQAEVWSAITAFLHEHTGRIS
jgi:2-hydroxy-6-oxonona-2,4-dienedioate hydrolase